MYARCILFFCQMRLPSTWNDKLNLKQIYRVPGCQGGGPKRIKAEVKRVPEFQGGGLQVHTSSGTGRGVIGVKGGDCRRILFSSRFQKHTTLLVSRIVPVIFSVLFFFLCNCIFVCNYIEISWAFSMHMV